MSDFHKHNASSYPDALLAEARGLELLAASLQKSGCRRLRTPRVLRVTARELVMSRVHSCPPSAELMEAAGEDLARMHRQPQSYYGFDEDNYIGLCAQINRLTDNWGEFFLQDRLGFQVGLIADVSIRRQFQAELDSSGPRLVEFLNTHCRHPSLLHGDLWAGNLIFDHQYPWLIDPAVYYGDREADIAMTDLFGGFSPEFYRGYDRVYPRSSVYPSKRAVYNLYHTLNHYNLFGPAYLEACRHNLQVIAGI